MSAGRYSILIVTSEFLGLFRNGGIGTAYTLLARELVRAGWDVTVLYAGDVSADPGKAIRKYESEGIRMELLEEFRSGYPWWQHLGIGNPHYSVQSEKVHLALGSLLKSGSYDLVEFHEYGGLGFRSVQARRSGLIQRCGIITKLHSSNQWLREANDLYVPYGPREAELDYCEQYSFEHADFRTSPTRYMLDWAAARAWNCGRSSVIRNALQVPDLPATSQPPGADSRLKEIVFFGRLEPRKGLFTFADALGNLNRPDIKVTFLGKDLFLPQVNTDARNFVKGKLRALDLNIITDMDQHQALAYLRRPSVLAVIPSRLEHFPNTVLECLVHGIPFLASGVGGIPETLELLDASSDHLFQPHAENLEIRLRELISEGLRRVTTRVAAETIGRINRTIVQDYTAMAEQVRSRPKPASRKTGQPMVSIGVPYFNMGRFVKDTLDALEKQDYSNYEVIVVDDGSTDEHSREVFEECRNRYSRFRFFST